MQKILKSAIKTLLIKANTTLERGVYEKLCGLKDKDKKALIIENCRLAKETGRPLCQDTGQVLVFIKLPYNFSFGFDFKKVINDAVEEAYKEEYYRKSVVKNAIFDRKNTTTNTPAIIYTDFENRESVSVDVLIKGGGAENMSFIKMYNPTTSEDEIIKDLSDEILKRSINACPPLFIGIGAGGTMDYAAVLSKKALFDGEENGFCEKLKEKCNSYDSKHEKLCHPEQSEGSVLDSSHLKYSCVQNDGITLDCRSSAELRNDNIVLSVKILSTSTHIASLPVAVTINCHSNRHAGCEIGQNGIIFNDEKYDIPLSEPDFSDYKKVNNLNSISILNQGDKILFSGTIYTMRDAAHKRIFEMLENGENLPFEIKDSIIFYAGPAPKKSGEIIGPIGPTTSKRMDKYAPKLYDLGCIATIGKGERSKKVIDACKKNNAHYFKAQGGVACLFQKCFKSAELVAFEDLGAEAVYKFQVENLPLKVYI